MLIVLIGLVIVIGVGVLAYFTEENDRLGAAFVASIVTTMIISITLALILSKSYSSYLYCRTFYDATLEQYSSAVMVYHDYAEIDITSAAWTDFKYKGYQENMAKFVRNLRNSIIGYNEEIISKRIMDKNPVFSWLIIAPDDNMKIIKMKTAINK